MRIPPFHSLGEDDGHFYVLAYVPGIYVASGKMREEAFFVLNFSPSAAFTRFSYATVSAEGRLFHYSRGADHVDSAEYTMLRAWREEGVPLHAWYFYPSAAIEESAFVRAEDRQGFEAARRRVAHILFHARQHVWMQRQFKVEPMFRFAEGDLPEPMTDTDESKEIEKYLTEDWGVSNRDGL